MQEAEEQDTCRICSAPGEPDQPLFYPCKCSGTIRYIHQDCLTTWLAHSKKKNCDVCKHPYSFTKVYAPDMPSRLPPTLLIRRLAQHSVLILLFILRAVVVGIVWLAVLPWVTVWTWRMYFTMGDSTAWWISDRPRPVPSNTIVSTSHHYRNTSSSDLNTTFTHPANTTFIERSMSRPFWRAISADIFAGQIIASLIVLTFVAVFLLREWISQNARPGVFEDEELFPEERDLPLLDPVVEEPQPEPQPQVVDAPAVPVQHPTAAPAGPVLANQDTGDRIVRHRHGAKRPRRHTAGLSSKRAEGSLRRRKDAGKGKAREAEGSGPESDTDFPDASRVRARARRRLNFENEGPSEDDHRRDISHDLRDVVEAAEMQDEAANANIASSSSAEEGGKFEFTFKAPTQLPAHRRSISELRASSSPTIWSSSFNSSRASPDSGSIWSPSSNHTESTDPTGSPSSSSDTLSSSASPPSDIPSLNPSVTERLFFPKPSVPSSPVRPPMPSATFPTPKVSTPPLAGGSARNGTQTPLASPSLATYRAPEELEVGPSRLSGYFGEDDLTEEELKNEHELYFKASVEEGGSAVDKDKVTRMPNFGRDLEDHAGSDDEGYEHVVAEDDEDDEDDDEDDDDDDEDEDDEDEEDEEEAEAEGGFGFGVEAEWEEDDEGDREEEPQLQGDQNVEQPAPGPDAPVEVADANDDLEGNVEDDMEGAMEAIGMRGPIYGVIQNAFLMIFVLDTAIGLGVWLPFTIGKSTALLSLEPQRFLQIIHFPIRTMRIVTDPVVDSVAFLIKKFALPPLLRVFHFTGGVVMYLVLHTITMVAGRAQADKASEGLTSLYRQSSEVVDRPWDKALQWMLSSEVSTDADASSAYSLGSIFEFEIALIRLAEEYFADRGKRVRHHAVRLQAAWVSLALGYGTLDRIFAVFLGYTVVGLLLALYLNILTVGNVKSAGRAARSAVRQQLLVLKVAVFIIIELVIFPFGCGVMLDLCSVWLFPEANLQSRAGFFLQAPVTAMFYHWVAGTMFMYQFAILLAGCRGIMRPGAMWFIKDPQDQNFHPIRDILDRPTLTQFRKLLVSAVMYSIVVAVGVGSVAGLLFIGFKSILPLRWKTREPISDVPIDLLFLHFILPYTMHYFRPKKVLTHLVVLVWKKLARQLRLTSYMFGDRYPMEEFTPRHSSWTMFLLNTLGLRDPNNIKDGTFRRVPASDNVALPREMRATAEVDANGEPVNESSAKLIQQQNAEAEKAKRNVKTDYTVVYIPPHFRYRTMLFILAIWIAFAIFLAAVLSLPILLGRSFFKLFTARDVHDGYSFITGFYLLWACYIVGKAVDRMDKRRQRRGHDGPRADFPLFLVKRSLLWLAKISYMLFSLGLIIPILISLVMDFYIILPIRLAVNPALQPRIRIVDTWALGLLYAKIAVQAHRLQQPTAIMRGLNNIANNGWTHPDLVAATKEVIGPVTGGLMLLLMFPAVVVWALRQFSLLPVDGKFIFTHMYPGLFVAVSFGRTVIAALNLLSSWSQSIRDKEFLVEMRLRNHEPEKEKKDVQVDTVEGELYGN